MLRKFVYIFLTILIVEVDNKAGATMAVSGTSLIQLFIAIALMIMIKQKVSTNEVNMPIIIK